MPSITLTDPVTATTVASGLIATNNANLRTLLNGGLDNTNLAPGFRTITSTFAGGPPSSPTDGDIWIATAVDANGTRWQFQYNSGSASTYKWEFIGGSPLRVENITASAVTTTVYADLGAAFTLARGGDYEIEFGGHIYNATTSGAVWIAVSKGGGAASDLDAVGIENVTTLFAITVAKKTSGLALAAGSITKLQVRVTGGQGYFSECYLHVRPVRVA